MKRFKVVMLPTNKADNCIITNNGTRKTKMYYNDTYLTQEYLKHELKESFHLYITDPNAKIKEGDYYTNSKNIFKCNALKDVDPKKYTYLSKIIVTTDVSLESVPQLSEQSIKLLIAHYNNNGTIPDEVDVEERNTFNKPNMAISELETLRGRYNDGSQLKEYFEGLKTNTIKLNSHGEVDITIPEEKIYNKEDARKLISDFAKDFAYKNGLDMKSSLDFTLKWIKTI